MLDIPARSLKVATRVRIPLGLQGLDSRELSYVLESDTVGAANWPIPHGPDQRCKSWVVHYQEM